MEDPGVDLSNEVDATSMALAAAEAAAAAEEHENLVSERQHHEQEQEQQQQQQQHEQQQSGTQQPKPSSQEEQNNSNNQSSQEIENSRSFNNRPVIRGDNTLSSQPYVVDNNEPPQLKCRICGKGPDDDGRILLRFLPTQIDINTATIAPGVVTFGQDISLHVFCGKTASILPNVNQPDLEILSKAGIKNKHGIGPEVNGALARTRSSTLQQEGTKEKTFYIVKEFEAHLATIRSASIGAAACIGVAAIATDQRLPPPPSQNSYHVSGVPLEHTGVAPHTIEPSMDMYHHPGGSHTPTCIPAPMPTASTVTTELNPSNTTKVIPHKAGQSFQKYHQRDVWTTLAPPDVTITADGKIRCGCGGTHLPTGTAKGDASWRSHVMTKRHQKWMEENGLLGAV